MRTAGGSQIAASFQASSILQGSLAALQSVGRTPTGSPYSCAPPFVVPLYRIPLSNPGNGLSTKRDDKEGRQRLDLPRSTANLRPLISAIFYVSSGSPSGCAFTQSSSRPKRARSRVESVSKRLNITGTRTSVRNVAMPRPKMTATAIGAHHALDSAPATMRGGHW